MVLDFKPTNYNLTLEPNFNTFTFTGKELLTFTVEKPLQTMRLDAEHISVKDVTREGQKVGYDISGDALNIDFGTPLTPGSYTVTIEFEGILADALTGWYRSSYETDVRTEWIATSQFEPAFARRAFPCVDHPLYKATFDITLITSSSHMAISNTLPTSETPLPNGKKQTTFAQSPRMSTYLLYLGVGMFEFKEDQYKQIHMRGIAVPGKSQYSTFALEVAKNTLAYCEDYFQKPYPLPKLDLLAIPDFVVGAMENWGAITFRENGLLYNPEKSSASMKQRVAIFVTHELAHQWFGNLVTMKWWDDLWLNESFATFMAYKAVDAQFPQWKMWTEFVTETVFGSMKLDSQRSTHPVQAHVTDIEEIEELFDEISYDKGASILRMIEGYLGADSFRNGLRDYIASFAYSNAEGADLWKNLEKSSGKNLSSIMETYILKQGFPMVSINADSAVTASQQRFFVLPPQTPDETQWHVPMVITAGNDQQRVLLSDKKQTIVQSTPPFLYANTGYTGFYLSRYTPELLKTLTVQMPNLSDIENLGFIHDYFYLLLAGQVSFEEFMTVYDAVTNPPTRTGTLRYALHLLQKLYIVTDKADLLPHIQADAQKALHITGYEPKPDENTLETSLRSEGIMALSFANDQEIGVFAQKQFDIFVNHPTLLHPDLWSPVLVVAARTSSANYEKILDLFIASKSQEEQAKYLGALGSTGNPTLIKHTLAFALDKHVRYAQLPYLYAALSANPDALPLLIPWLTEQWKILTEHAQGSTMILRRMLKLILPYAGAHAPDTATKFLDSHPVKGLENTIEQIKEEMSIYVNLRKNIVG